MVGQGYMQQCINHHCKVVTGETLGELTYLSVMTNPGYSPLMLNVWDFLVNKRDPSQKQHPGRLTWSLQITHLERKMIFQTSMIMFHVNLPGWSSCEFFYPPSRHLMGSTLVMRVKEGFPVGGSGASEKILEKLNHFPWKQEIFKNTIFFLYPFVGLISPITKKVYLTGQNHQVFGAWNQISGVPSQKKAVSVGKDLA